MATRRYFRDTISIFAIFAAISRRAAITPYLRRQRFRRFRSFCQRRHVITPIFAFSPLPHLLRHFSHYYATLYSRRFR